MKGSPTHHHCGLLCTCFADTNTRSIDDSVNEQHWRKGSYIAEHQRNLESIFNVDAKINVMSKSEWISLAKQPHHPDSKSYKL